MSTNSEDTENMGENLILLKDSHDSFDDDWKAWVDRILQ